MRKVLIILPTYKEKENLETLIPSVFKQQEKLKNWEINILVVDSSSPDGTEKLLQEYKKKFGKRLDFLITKKEGLGKAYYRGFKYALEKIRPYVIFEMDADWSHDPNLIPKFLKKIEKGADFVIGARYIKGGSIPKNWGTHRKLFSIVGNWIIRIGFAKLKIHDWTSGYRAIKSWVIKKALDHVKKYNSYVFQVALLDKAIKIHASIDQVPLHFKDRTKGYSKINSSQYIVHTLFYTFTNSPFIRFLIVGTTGFVIDFSVSFLNIEILGINEVLGNGIGAETAIISNFMLNNFWTFSHKKIKGGAKSYIIKFLKFNLISLGNVFMQMFGIWIALNLFGNRSVNLVFFTLKSWIIYKILIIVFFIIPLSYLLYNKIVWRRK